jgi:integrase
MNGSKAGAPQPNGAGQSSANRPPRQPPRMVKNRGGARVRLSGRDFYLGPWGSEAATTRYAELIAEWLQNHGSLPAPQATPDPEGATVDELIALYVKLELATRPASMRARIRLALLPLHEMFGQKVAAEFTALHLTELRTAMVQSGRLARHVINQRVGFIRGMFTWAAAMGQLDERVPFRLSTLKSLRRNTATREPRVVQPADWPTVEATLRHLSEPLRGLVWFQWLTGARPGEACALTADAIDRSGKVWIYTPREHKTAHHGKSRSIAIGPQCQSLLRPFMVRRPAEAIAEQKAARARQRRGPVQPSQVERARQRAERPKLEIAEGYEVEVYRRALDRAVDAANAETKRAQLHDALCNAELDERTRAAIGDAIDRLPVHIRRPARERFLRRVGDALPTDDTRRAGLAEIVADVLDAPGKFQHWHPHRLRHAYATRAMREVGDLEATRLALGHSSDAMTRHYAKPGAEKIIGLAERIG